MLPPNGIPVRAYGVATLLLREAKPEHQVLLLRRADSLAGEWCQVSGKIEAGESAWQAALREVREETGLAPNRFYSADLCEQFYEIDRDSIWIAPVFVGYVSPNQEVVLNAEHTEYLWTSFQDALTKLSFAGQRRIFRHVHAEFVQCEPSRWLRIQTKQGSVTAE